MTIGKDCLVGSAQTPCRPSSMGATAIRFPLLSAQPQLHADFARLAPCAQRSTWPARGFSLLGRLELAHPGGLLPVRWLAAAPTACASCGPMQFKRRRTHIASVFCSASSICI